MAEPAKSAKIWRVGTLTYTTGGLLVVIGWLLLAGFAWSMHEHSVGPMAQWYLDHLNIPNLSFGLFVMSFPSLIGLLSGPIISVRSDRHRGRLGRRIPFLLIMAPIAALGMIGIAFTPVIARQLHASLLPAQNGTTVALVCLGLSGAVFAFAIISTQSVFGGLINDVVPVEILGRFCGLLRAANLIAGITFSYWIMGLVPARFTLILSAIGIFYCTAFMWGCHKVREGKYPRPSMHIARPEPDTRNRTVGGGFIAEVRTYCRECFTHPYYLVLFAMLTAAALAFGPVNVFSIPYARSLGVDMNVYGKMLAMTFLILLGLSWFLGWLCDRFHPLRMVMVALAAYTLVAAWGSIYAGTSRAFLCAWVMHGVISGCYWACVASLGQRLYPHSRFAQFASAAAMLLAIGNMIMAPAIGALIDVSGGCYRMTFAIGALLAMSALGCAIHVHGRFTALGGPCAYVAPE